MGLGGGKSNDSSIVFRTFRGGIKLITRRIKVPVPPPPPLCITCHSCSISAELKCRRRLKLKCVASDVLAGNLILTLCPLWQVPFSLLTLDLPPAPLFKDEQEKNIIPQVRYIFSQLIPLLNCHVISCRARVHASVLLRRLSSAAQPHPPASGATRHTSPQV
jgi:hypothetical protein